MIGSIVEQSDLIGDIKGFPIEVVQKMVDEQMSQGAMNVSVFQKDKLSYSGYGGFTWADTSDGHIFWTNVIVHEEFDVFFNKYPKQQIKMEEKSIKINAPEGYEIDEVNSSFTEIKFKPIESKYPKSWNLESSNDEIKGFWINNDSEILRANGFWSNRSINVFKTERQAKSMLAYAQITQLMALPCYNGDWVADWCDGKIKYVILRKGVKIIKDFFNSVNYKIAFKSEEVRDAFYDNHMDLLKTYFELD